MGYNIYIMKKLKMFLIFFICFSCCAKSKDDPLEPLNRGIYRFNRVIDAMYLKPISRTYSGIMPYPIKVSASNFLRNVGGIPTVSNQILQGKASYAANDIARVLINSTLGIFGLFDVATPMGLPYHKEDFGQTLIRWGYKRSTYLMLPILGPSTVRDGIGLAVNSFISVPYYIKPKWRNRYFALFMLDKRADLKEAEDLLEAAGVDEYTMVRNAYFQRRQYVANDQLVTETYDDEYLGEPPD